MHMSHYATMVNCLLEDTSKSTVNLLQLRVHICSSEAKKKQAVRDEQVSYLHVAPL